MAAEALHEVKTRCQPIVVGLLLAHLLLGVGAAWLGTWGPWATSYVLAFGGLVCGQVVLLGIWSGLASKTWGVRIAGLVCGSFYISTVCAIGGGRTKDSLIEDSLILACLVCVTASMIGLLFMALHRYRGIAVAYSNETEVRRSAPIQFTMMQLLSVTTVISVLLGSGRVIRSLGGESLGIGVLLIAFVICGCVMACLVAWAGLGHGHISLRFATVLVIGFVVGLLPPYFLGGPWWRFLTWPGLVVATGIVAVLSLLVVRSCGYRLVRMDLTV